MNTNTILPCPMCGSPAKVGFTGTLECYGKDWQVLYIECTKEKEKDGNCGMELSLSADFWDIRNAEDVLTEAWNKLDRKTFWS